MTHNATVIAHGFMHAGTTIDIFLRDNLEWLLNIATELYKEKEKQLSENLHALEVYSKLTPAIMKEIDDIMGTKPVHTAHDL